MVQPVEAHHVGVLHSAGAAPRGPEVNEDYLAAETAQLAYVAVAVGHLDLRGFHAGEEGGAQTVVDVLDKLVLGPAVDEGVADFLIQSGVLFESFLEVGHQESTHEYRGIAVEEGVEAEFDEGRYIPLMVLHVGGGDDVGEFFVERHVGRALGGGDVEVVECRHVVDAEGYLFFGHHDGVDGGAVAFGEAEDHHEGVGGVAFQFDMAFGIGGEGIDGYQSASLGLTDHDAHVFLQPVEGAVEGASLGVGGEGRSHDGYE